MRVPFDFKREYAALYRPKEKSALVEVPPMNYVTVAGRGDPNDPQGNAQILRRTALKKNAFNALCLIPQVFVKRQMKSPPKRGFRHAVRLCL